MKFSNMKFSNMKFIKLKVSNQTVGKLKVSNMKFGKKRRAEMNSTAKAFVPALKIYIHFAAFISSQISPMCGL
jgi:hypothetical protein